MTEDDELGNGWLARRREKRREKRQRDEYYRGGRSPEPSMLESVGYHRRTGRWEWLENTGCIVVTLLAATVLYALFVASHARRAVAAAWGDWLS